MDTQELFTITLKYQKTTLDAQFVMCYLAANQINYSDLDLTKKGKWTVITNEKILNDIKMRYQYFLLSGQELEKFFNRQIVIVRETRGRNSPPQFIIETEEINSRPIFMIMDRNQRVKHGADFRKFTSEKPIKMQIKLIFEIHGKICPEDFPNTFPAYVQTYPVISGQAIRNREASGKSKSPEVIRIGHEGSNWYWIPNEQMIITVYRCTKYPGKCLYKTSDWGNFQKHVSVCTDETTVQSKQVIWEGP